MKVSCSNKLCQPLDEFVQILIAAERRKFQIIGHGINGFVNRGLIYNFLEELFADAGVRAIERADFDDIEQSSSSNWW